MTGQNPLRNSGEETKGTRIRGSSCGSCVLFERDQRLVFTMVHVGVNKVSLLQREVLQSQEKKREEEENTRQNEVGEYIKHIETCIENTRNIKSYVYPTKDGSPDLASKSLVLQAGDRSADGVPWAQLGKD